MTASRNFDTQVIAAVLKGEGYDLTNDQLAALTDLIEQVGSVENALKAVKALSELKRAA